MERLTYNELLNIYGGGYWYQLPNGNWIYVSDDEESADDISETYPKNGI